jgi:hypothetical protein
MQKRNELLKKLLLKKRNDVVAGLETQMGRKLIRETGQKIDSAMDSADQSALDVDQGIDYPVGDEVRKYKDIADASASSRTTPTACARNAARKSTSNGFRSIRLRGTASPAKCRRRRWSGSRRRRPVLRNRFFLTKIRQYSIVCL